MLLKVLKYAFVSVQYMCIKFYIKLVLSKSRFIKVETPNDASNLFIPVTNKNNF